MPAGAYHRAQPTAPPTPRNGVLVLSGYGLRVFTRRRHLVCEDGWCDERRTARFHRATAGLQRLVLFGRGGTMTLEALRWLHDVGAGLICVHLDGTVLLSSGPRGLDDARLRRAQALAPSTEAGVRITRELLSAKLAAQADVLAQLPNPDAQRAVREQLDVLHRADTLERLRLVEARAGTLYWEAWRPLPVRWATADARRVPEHWKTVGPRISPITGSPRLAATPAHALLNLLYALLEAEATIACQAVGLDPGLGILHADQPARASLSLDLMEPVRPAVDAFVLDLLRTRVFSARDFQEVSRGQVRVLLPLSRALLATSPRWAQAVAPWAERVAALLAETAGSRRRLPTPLTQANRSAGREGIRKAAPNAPALPGLEYTVCVRCGVVLEARGRMFCDDCGKQDKTERIVAAGLREFARRRRTGVDPSHGGQAARRRAEALRRRRREARAWDETHPRPDPEVFRREILPLLRSVPLERIVRAAGISLRYASLIRRGLYVPHPRHWEALRRAVETRDGWGEAGMVQRT
ncbi:MAG: CRISPR-associated endonuclease Cas1 [Armatimonadota bacterium]|nr:CRISPR-associated endonuclease Cas1 [Armatimonadota bacterium]